MSIYTALQEIQTAINGMGTAYKTVDIGSNFSLDRSNCPLAIIKLEDGDLAHHTRMNGTVHIIGFFFKEKNVEQTTLDEMENMIVTMRNNIEWLDHNSFQLFIDNNVFDVFGVQMPVMAPFGAFRLSYPMRQDLLRNT